MIEITFQPHITYKSKRLIWKGKVEENMSQKMETL